MKLYKKQLLSFVIISTVFSLFFVFNGGLNSVSAQQQTQLYNSQVGLGEVGSVYGQKRPDDIRITAAKMIRLVLSLLGAVFLGLVIFAGFKWMTSGGNEEGVKGAKKMLANSVIGLVIIIVSWSITTWLIERLHRIAVNQAVDFLN